MEWRDPSGDGAGRGFRLERSKTRFIDGHRLSHHRHALVGAALLRPATSVMTTLRRCAVYTRKSSEDGLEQAFNSLHAQREACEAYIKSQAHDGWGRVKAAYDDGGFSGGSMERPALQRLLAEVAAGRINVVVVYKVDRLTRSLAAFPPI